MVFFSKDEKSETKVGGNRKSKAKKVELKKINYRITRRSANAVVLTMALSSNIISKPVEIRILTQNNY